MSTVTESATKTDAELVRLRSDPAREELRQRVEWRRKHGMNLDGLIRRTDIEAAPEETVELLADLDVPVAVAERQRRGGLR
jgi:hypothetical protein